MFNSINEIENIVKEFCDKNKISMSEFEISSISNATGGINERLFNTTKVKNKECRFVIKYYASFDWIVIWDYKQNKSMSYSAKTIREKLNKGIRKSDKGTGFHTSNQALVYFSFGKELSQLLGEMFNKI